MTGRLFRGVVAVVAGLALALTTAAAASAHPLGNFTINHYAGLRVGPRSIALDVVIDMAEIPAFEERQQLDRNGDGDVDARETDDARTPLCRVLAQSLHLIDGHPLSLELRESGLSFPTGSSGLPTLRLVCEFEALLPGGSPQTLHFADASYPGRIGWREIVVDGDGATVSSGAGTLLSASVSARLTSYPTSLLAAPLAMPSADFTAQPGGPAAAPLAITDAAPLTGRLSPAPVAAAGAVPGGSGDGLSGILQARDLTPPVIAVSLLIALLLGAVHALSPGHGKTVMAAYLVGARGTATQAAALGLVVTVSHTLGVLGVAALVLAASDLLPPERIYPILSVAAGLLVVAIGLYLVLTRLRELRVRHRPADAPAEHPHAHEHEHEHAHAHEHGHDAEHVHAHGVGPFRHSHDHAAVDGSPGALRWRGLAALGLAGGLVPSASAVLLLLGSLAAGRAGYGLVLVLAFGLGMAVVLVGIGLTLVYAGRVVERLDFGTRGVAIARAIPSLTAVAVLLGGVVLTIQALHPVL